MQGGRLGSTSPPSHLTDDAQGADSFAQDVRVIGTHGVHHADQSGDGSGLVGRRGQRIQGGGFPKGSRRQLHQLREEDSELTRVCVKKLREEDNEERKT